MCAERGAVEIFILITVALLLFVITKQTNCWQMLSMLLGDSVHSYQVQLDIKNSGLNKLIDVKPRSTFGLNCLEDSVRHGRITRASYLCFKINDIRKGSPLIHFERLFASAFKCPKHKRTVSHDNSFKVRSQFACESQEIDLDSRTVVLGDYYRTSETRFGETEGDSLLAASGSVLLQNLRAPPNLLLVSLGDVLINQVYSGSSARARLTIIAPTGRVTIRASGPNISYTIVSQSEDIPSYLPKVQWRTHPLLPTLEVLPYGFFSRTL